VCQHVVWGDERSSTVDWRIFGNYSDLEWNGVRRNWWTSNDSIWCWTFNDLVRWGTSNDTIWLYKNDWTHSYNFIYLLKNMIIQNSFF
jgi:hypothetical protein